jgi:two-component system copper resistance phosphate regulon response regulator CusR
VDRRSCLIVDDDAKFRGYIGRGLQESGLDCSSAGDTDEALELLCRGHFDVILLDVMMPGRSGWEFLQDLRRRDQQTPVIFLTARHAVEERVKGLRLGADDYIIKPFEFSELLARIEVVLRRRPRAALEVGDLRLDLSRRVVERGGRRIRMTPQEFDLLRVLVEARGRVLSRSELLREVWNVDFDPGTNVVQVQVARLRRKIDACGPPLIQTVVGRGYAIAPEPPGAA